MGSIDFEIRGDNRPFMKALDGLSKGVDDTAKKVKHTGKEIEDIFKDIAALAGISFSLNGIAEFASKVFEIRSYFQDINSSMKVFLGNQEKADKFTNELLDYAYYNMFEFSDLAKASQQLIAYGNDVNDIIPILDKLSNVASGTGANLEELIGLYNKAKSTGFVDSQAMYSWATRGIVIKDVLKDMGEAATGSSISFEQLNKVLNHVTGEGGLFHGLMASQMDNLSASMGQFEDDFTSAMNEIGEMLQGPMKQMIDWGDKAVGNYKEIGKIILECVGVIGTYRAALVASNAIGKEYILTMRVMALHNANAAAGTAKLSAAQTFLNISTVRLTASLKALAAATVLNPYVMAAATFTALAYAVYKVLDYTNEYAAEEERLNERTEEQNKIVKKNTEEIEKNISKLGDELKTLSEKKAIYDELHSKYPNLFADYKSEKDLIEKIALARKMDNFEIERKLKLQNRDANFSSDKTRLDELREMHNLLTNPRNKADEQRYKELFNKYAADIQKVKRFGDTLADATSRLMETTASTINSTMNDMRSDAADAFDEILKTMNQDQLSEAVSRYQKAIKKAQSQGKKWIQLSGDTFSTSVDEMQRRIDLAKRRANDLDRESNRDYVREAKKNYEDAQRKVKEIYKNRNDKALYPTEQAYMDAIKKAKEEEKSAKSAFEAVIPSGMENEVKAMKNASFKYDQLVKNYGKKTARDIVDYQFEIEQNTINALKEGREKTEKQLDLNFRKQMNTIDRWYEDLKEEKIKKEKELWLASNPKKTEADFNISSVDTTPTADETALYESKKKAAEEVLKKGLSDIAKAEVEALNEYYREYGKGKQRTDAIIEYYSRQIDEASTEGLKKSLKAKMQEAINEARFDDLKDEIEWDFIFGNVDDAPVEILDLVIKKLTEYKDMAKDLKPEDMKTIVEAMESVQSVRNDRGNPLENFKIAKKELEDATTAYELAKSKGDNARMLDSYKKMQKAQKKMDSAWDEGIQTAENYGKALNSLGETIGGTSGACLTLASSAISAGLGMANGIKKFGDAANALEKSVAVLAVVEASMQAISMISGIFGGEDSSLVNYADAMSRYIGILNRQISELNTSINDTKNSIKETIEYYKQLESTQKEAADTLKTQSSTWLQSGGSKGFFGFGVKKTEGEKIAADIQKGLNSSNKETKEYYKAIYDVLNEYYKSVYGKDAKAAYIKEGWKQDVFGSMEWIWKMSDEQIKALSQNAKVMAALGNDFAEAITNYVEYLDEIEGLGNKEFSDILDFDFGSFYDNFTDMVSDMNNDTSDFSNNFGEKLKNALVKNLIASRYRESLMNLYESAGKYAQEGTLEAHIGQLREEYAKYADSAKKEIEAIDKVIGTTSSFSQEASIGSKIAASQDSIDEVNGRFTAVQIASEGTRTAVENALMYIEQMATFCISSGVAVSEIRNLLVLGNSYLEDIAKYSKSIYNEFGTKIDKMIKSLE